MASELHKYTSQEALNAALNSDRDALKVLFNLQSNSGQWQERLGMSPDQWNDLIRRLNDPADPAGNYRSPGGDTVNISDRD